MTLKARDGVRGVQSPGVEEWKTARPSLLWAVMCRCTPGRGDSCLGLGSVAFVVDIVLIDERMNRRYSYAVDGL